MKYITTKSVGQHKECLGRYQRSKIQFKVEIKKKSQQRAKRKKKLSYSSEAHQRILPPNITVKIEGNKL